MSKSKTIDNIRKEVTDVFDEEVIGDVECDEEMEMKVVVHTQRIIRGGFGKKLREQQKMKNSNTTSKHSQNSHSKRRENFDEM